MGVICHVVVRLVFLGKLNSQQRTQKVAHLLIPGNLFFNVVYLFDTFYCFSYKEEVKE